MEKIEIDEQTQLMLTNIMRGIRELRTQMEIICQTYINSKGAKGKYELSPDGKTLIEIVEIKVTNARD